MELSRQIAEKIVAEVNHIIPQKINLMDPRGIIIASTDPARVGAFHGGAYRIVSEGLSEVVVHRDGEYAGALRGLERESFRLHGSASCFSWRWRARWRKPGKEPIDCWNGKRTALRCGSAETPPHLRGLLCQWAGRRWGI